jgi:basic amino acid/polyamine antiporter, APA family
MTTAKPPEKIGLFTSTSLVVGNMIASGVFLLPASIAAYGGIGLLGWIGSSAGAIVLALLFSRLSKRIPNALGGPYAYTRAGLGDFAAYLVAWGYWISIWCTNAAIAVAFVSYLTVFFEVLKTNSFLALGTGLSAIWLLTWVNTRGVKEVGWVQKITTVLKITPLLLVTVMGLFYVDFNNFVPFNISSVSNLSAITATATLTLFAFLGLESATIPAGNIHEPEKTIPRATMIGTVITIFIYVLSSTVVMGMIPAAELKNSNAPFADAAAIIWGDTARYWVAAGAIVSTLGALNGWILLQGQMPMAAARDKLFPVIFNKENNKGVPAFGIIIGSVLISGLMMLNFTSGLNDTFTFMVLMTTLTVLIPYLFSATSYGIMILQDKFWKRDLISQLVIAMLAFLFSLWAVLGSGQEAVYWGFIAILSGIPFYVWMKRAQ